ncbi:hypothetical protein ACFY19_20775 [Streptosporangium saharense]
MSETPETEEEVSPEPEDESPRITIELIAVPRVRERLIEERESEG